MLKAMKRLMVLALLILAVSLECRAHNVGNAITWNREISRIMYARCASCHRDGGTAFSLMTYQEVQPRAVEIKDAVLSRTMPPWGAVKGFGDFRNDAGLTQAELDLITDWVDSDTPKGNNPNTLPKEPKFEKASAFKLPKNQLTVSGDTTLSRAVSIEGILPLKVPAGASMRVIASLPSGETQPLVWLYEYKDSYRHPFLFRKLLSLPAGTVIRGIPSNATAALILR